MAAQTWDSALARASAAAGRIPQVAANIAVLTQLRERKRNLGCVGHQPEPASNG